MEYALPSLDDQVDNLNGDEIDGEKGEHHEGTFGLLAQPRFQGVFTRSLLQLVDDWSRMLLDVGDKVEEAARDVDGEPELTRSVDERDFKIDHDTDGPVDERRAVFKSDLLHQA